MASDQASAAWLRRLTESGFGSLNGFEVEALDGSAGQIDQVLCWSDARTPDYIVVGTRRWFLGRASVISFDRIEDVDVDNRRLKIGLSKEEIRQSPEFLP